MRKHESAGFAIGTILLAVILIAIIAAAIAVASRSSQGGKAQAKAKVNASAILAQAAGIQQNYERQLLDSGWAANQILFDSSVATASGTGLFNPENGGAVPVAPIDAVIRGNINRTPVIQKQWYLRRNVFIPGVSAGTEGSVIIFLPGVDNMTCQMVNKLLVDGSIKADHVDMIPSTGLDVADFTTNAMLAGGTVPAAHTTTAGPTPLTMVGNTAFWPPSGSGVQVSIIGNPELCAGADGGVGDYLMYYKVVKP